MTEETGIPELRDHFVQRRIFVGDDIMIIERFDQVTLLHSTLKSGVSKSGHAYQRWAHEDYHYFSARQVLRDGTRQFNVYRKFRSRKRWFFENVSGAPSGFGIWAGERELRDAVIRMYERTIGPVSERLRALPLRALTVALAYPAVTESIVAGRGPVECIPRGLGRVYRINDARTMTERLLGKRRVRKDVVKAVARSTTAHHAIAHAARRFVPVDWLVEYMNDDRLPVQDQGYNLDVLAVVDLPSRRALLLDTFEQGAWSTQWRLVRDTSLLLGRIREEADDDSWVTPAVRKAKTWRSLHDEIARIQRILAFGDKPIEQDEFYQSLDGVAVGDSVAIVSAKALSDLHAWGEAMDNCIAGYTRWALQHATYLFGVLEEGKLIANMEISPDGDIRQLYGRFNQHLSPDLDDAIRTTVGERLAATVEERTPALMAA